MPRHSFRSRPKRRSSTHRFAAAVSTAALLSACGGGSSGGSTAIEADQVAAEPPPPATVAISGTVADGPLSGATVCYDINKNAACDADEPTSAPTDADGRYSFNVTSSIAGMYPVLAVVPASAVDKDTGVAVGDGYSLQSPASGVGGAQAVFVSPLTTLVQAHIEASGSRLDESAAFVQSQAGLSMSPLADFTAPAAQSSPEGKQAAMVARLAMLTWQQQAAAISGVVGQVDLSGTAASPADLRRAVVTAVLGALPAVGAAASEPAVASAATPAARAVALSEAAQAIVAQQTDLTAANALATIGIAKLPADTTADTPAASGTLNMLRFTDADNWIYRALLSTADDQAPDASGSVRWYDLRSQRVAGTTTSWGTGNTPDRANDQHWNGSAWVECPLGRRSSSKVRDAAGRNNYSYCDSREVGFSQRSAVDLGGKTLRSVAETIRKATGSQLGVAYADWGPADLDLLGNAVFPADARLFYQTSTPTSTAPAYDVRTSNWVSAYPPAVAEGGDARSGTPPCAQITAANSPLVSAPVASLEDLMARNPAKPCVLNRGSNANGNSGDVNEWWSNSTANLGSLPNAATVPQGTGTYYNTTALLRVGFVPGSNTANYYSCLQRADTSARNCSLLSTGTYRIDTLGDARVMRFTGLPAMAQRLSYSRLFVERGGKVFFGYQNQTGAANATVRLNLPAANAVFTQLGLPPLTPTQ